jgi:hypothetical protein
MMLMMPRNRKQTVLIRFNKPHLPQVLCKQTATHKRNTSSHDSSKKGSTYFIAGHTGPWSSPWRFHSSLQGPNAAMLGSWKPRGLSLNAVVGLIYPRSTTGCYATWWHEWWPPIWHTYIYKYSISLSIAFSRSSAQLIYSISNYNNFWTKGQKVDLVWVCLGDGQLLVEGGEVLETCSNQHCQTSIT